MKDRDTVIALMAAQMWGSYPKEAPMEDLVRCARNILMEVELIGAKDDADT